MPFASGFVGISNYLNIFIFLNKDDIRKPSHYTCETGRLPWDRTFSRAISDLLIMVILMRSAVCVLRGKEKNTNIGSYIVKLCCTSLFHLYEFFFFFFCSWKRLLTSAEHTRAYSSRFKI